MISKYLKIKINTLIRMLISRFGDLPYNYFNYYYLHLKKFVFPSILNINKPRSFNEKIIYLKIHNRYNNSHIYADKILVRDYVANKIGESYLIPLLGIYDSPEDIDFTNLPEQFVIKTNHASGQVIICHSKRTLDIHKTIRMLRYWLSINYYEIGREYQYKNIKPRILIEKYLDPDNDGELKDYKIFCFDGKPKFIQVDVDRHTNHKRNFYDLEWNKLPFQILYPPYEEDIQPPASLKEMIRCASKLAEGFILVRIDFYCVRKKVYFGEITLHPEGGFGPIVPHKYDRILGDLINLDKL